MIKIGADLWKMTNSDFQVGGANNGLTLALAIHILSFEFAPNKMSG